MIKKWIIKLFKINTYEKEYKKYEKLYQNALIRGEMIKSVAQNYKRELENLKASFYNDMVEEMDEESFKMFCEENEIKIDDLAEIENNEDMDKK